MELVNTIYNGGGPILCHYHARIGQGGVLKADNQLHVEKVAVLAENEKRLVLNDRYFTTLSLESKSYIHTCLNKEVIYIYANDSTYGSSVHYDLYSFKKVQAATIRRHIEKAIKERYGFLVNGLDLSCIVEPKGAKK